MISPKRIVGKVSLDQKTYITFVFCFSWFRLYGFSIKNVLSSITTLCLDRVSRARGELCLCINRCNYLLRVTVVLEVRRSTYTSGGLRTGGGRPVIRCTWPPLSLDISGLEEMKRSLQDASHAISSYPSREVWHCVLQHKVLIWGFFSVYIAENYTAFTNAVQSFGTHEVMCLMHPMHVNKLKKNKRVTGCEAFKVT